jgi:hypothetical protein
MFESEEREHVRGYESTFEKECRWYWKQKKRRKQYFGIGLKRLITGRIKENSIQYPKDGCGLYRIVTKIRQYDRYLILCELGRKFTNREEICTYKLSTQAIEYERSMWIDSAYIRLYYAYMHYIKCVLDVCNKQQEVSNSVRYTIALLIAMIDEY